MKKIIIIFCAVLFASNVYGYTLSWKITDGTDGSLVRIQRYPDYQFWEFDVGSVEFFDMSPYVNDPDSVYRIWIITYVMAGQTRVLVQASDKIVLPANSPLFDPPLGKKAFNLTTGYPD